MKVLTAATNKMMDNINKSIQAVSPRVDAIRYVIDKLEETARAIEINELEPYLNKELAKPEYGGQSIDDLYNKIEFNEDGAGKEDSLYYRAIAAARSAKQKEDEKLKLFIAKELAKPEYGGQSIDDLFDMAETDEDGNILDTSLYARAMAAARAAKMGPKLHYNKGTEITFNTDKFTNKFFSSLAPAGYGNLSAPAIGVNFIKTTSSENNKKKESKQAMLYYDYILNTEEAAKHNLSPVLGDKGYFVASVLDNLLDENNPEVSLTKIWHELGNTGKPAPKQLEDLLNFLKIGMGTLITVNKSEIYEAWGITPTESDKKDYIYNAFYIKISDVTHEINGGLTSATIKIIDHTPFYDVGRLIEQKTTFNKDILKLYTGKRTARYYKVMHYLLREIGWLRNQNSKRSNKLSYKTLYEYCGDTTTRSRQLTREMMYRILDECFIPLKYIVSYKEESRGEIGVKLKYTISKNKKLKL